MTITLVEDTPEIREAINQGNAQLVAAFGDAVAAPAPSDIDWKKRAAHWKARSELNEQQARLNADTIKAQAEAIRRLTAQLSRASSERNLLNGIVREMEREAVTLAGETRERTLFSIHEESLFREMCCNDIECDGSRHQASDEELRYEYGAEANDRD